MQQVNETLTPTELFAQFAREGFALRDPPTDLRGLRHSVATGCCLEPLIYAGDELYADFGATPSHGDLVVFDWPQETVERWKASEKGAAWFGRWGVHDMTRGCKLWWEFPRAVPEAMRTRYLLTNSDVTRVRDHKIVGVVRAVVRKDTRLETLGLAACASLDNNAATVVFIASNATTGGTVGLPSGHHQLSPLTGAANTSPVFDCTVIVTATIVGGQSGGTAGLQLGAFYTDDGGTTYQYGPYQQLTLSPLPYTVQWQFNHLAANTGSTWTAGIDIDNPTGGTLTFQYGTGVLNAQAEFIKK